MAEVEPRRHRKAHLGLAFIASIFDVPDDVKVVRMVPTYDPDGFDIILSSDRFDPVEPNAESPYLGTIIGHRITDEGKGYVRFEIEAL